MEVDFPDGNQHEQPGPVLQPAAPLTIDPMETPADGDRPSTPGYQAMLGTGLQALAINRHPTIEGSPTPIACGAVAVSSPSPARVQPEVTVDPLVGAFKDNSPASSMPSLEPISDPECMAVDMPRPLAFQDVEPISDTVVLPTSLDTMVLDFDPNTPIDGGSQAFDVDTFMSQESVTGDNLLSTALKE